MIDNHFSTIFYPKVGAYGAWTDCEDEDVRGNVYHETGQPLPPSDATASHHLGTCFTVSVTGSVQ